MKKIIICLSVENFKETEELKHLADVELFKNNEVHFLTVFKKQKYFSETSYIEFPGEGQLNDIEQSVYDIQKRVAEKILDEDTLKHTKYVCLFDGNAKIQVKKYLENQKANLVVTSVRKHGIEGLFVSSFTDYLTQYAPCDVYVVKDHS